MANKRNPWEADYTFNDVHGPTKPPVATVPRYILKHKISCGYRTAAGDTTFDAKTAERFETREAAAAACEVAGKHWKIWTIRIKM